MALRIPHCRMVANTTYPETCFTNHGGEVREQFYKKTLGTVSHVLYALFLGQKKGGETKERTGDFRHSMLMKKEYLGLVTRSGRGHCCSGREG